MSLHQRIKSDLTTAMKERTPDRVRVLRSLLTAIANAEAVPDIAQSSEPAIGAFASEAARRSLSDVDVRELVRSEIEELRGAHSVYQDANATDRADAIDDELEVLEQYLED